MSEFYGRVSGIVTARERAIAALRAAEESGAPFEECERLAHVVADVHGEAIEPRYMSRAARMEELTGYEDAADLEGGERAELAFLRGDDARTPRDHWERGIARVQGGR